MRIPFVSIDAAIKRAGQQLAEGGQALLGRHHSRIGGGIEDDAGAVSRPWTVGLLSRMNGGAPLAVSSTHPWVSLRRTDPSERGRHCGSEGVEKMFSRL